MIDVRNSNNKPGRKHMKCHWGIAIKQNNYLTWAKWWSLLPDDIDVDAEFEKEWLIVKDYNLNKYGCIQPWERVKSRYCRRDVND